MNFWKDKILPTVRARRLVKKSVIPEGLWLKCLECDAVLYRPELEKSMEVCPKCDYHYRISARKRLYWFLDEADRVEYGAEIESYDQLKFRDTKKYKDRLMAAQKDTSEKDALVVIGGCLKEMPVICAAFEFAFMGGSMGSSVGARFVRAVDVALEQRVPLICFSASGGARMQEGLYSLMQMAKTSAVLARLKEQGLPFISVLTDPSYGGVTASLAMLGDINIAEPKAMIGFAGPRVIEQTVRQTLPEGFQRAEFLLKHGMLDMIVHRHHAREHIHSLLMKLMGVRLCSSDTQ